MYIVHFATSFVIYPSQSPPTSFPCGQCIRRVSLLYPFTPITYIIPIHISYKSFTCLALAWLVS